MRTMAPVNLIVHHPQTDEGRDALARRVADVHAASVIRRLKALNCPTCQKQALLDAVIAAAKQQSREQD